MLYPSPSPEEEGIKTNKAITMKVYGAWLSLVLVRLVCKVRRSRPNARRDDTKNGTLYKYSAESLGWRGDGDEAQKSWRGQLVHCAAWNELV